MARPIVRNIPFSGLEVNFSGPPGGFVWTVQITVPKAQPYQSYLILLDGVQVASMQGTAVYGPIQLYPGNNLTIVNNAGGVTAGQSGIMYGQVDQEGHQPSGVFPAVSGGTVQTTGLNQIIWQGTWDSATTYAVNDLVEYEGSSYICIAVNSDTIPTNTSFWNLVAEEGATGPAGPTGPQGPVGMNWTGPWSSSTAYAVGDGVYQNGSSYICIVANTNEPPPDTGYWNELAAQATGVDATSIQGVAVSATAPTTGQVIEYNGTEYAPAAPSSGLAYSPFIPAFFLATLPASVDWFSVAYGNGVFVGVAYASADAAYSTDGGQTWTLATLPASVDWFSVAYGNGVFVTVAFGSAHAAYTPMSFTT